jgi:hypothetical protein
MDEILKEAEKTLGELGEYWHQCHVASLKLVQAGIADRVARGTCKGVGGQHSWAVIGENVYSPKITVIDPTLWSYRADVEGIYIGSPLRYSHRPHGAGSIWAWGRPERGRGPSIKLTPSFQFSKEATEFLALIGDLDWEGWHNLLAKAPVEGWPAGEIMSAAYETSELVGVVPIDRLGMLTDKVAHLYRG